MSQEIEIEFKNILSYEEFLRIINDFAVVKSAFKEQKNYYFDTDDFQLKKHKSALRVRLKNHTYTLTLKQQYEQHILETHQPLSEDEFSNILKGQPFPNGDVTQVLEKLDIHIPDLQHLGELTTHRVEIPFKDGVLVLDENHYLGKIDYELEYESTDYKEGEKIFLDLLRSKNIPYRETKSKIYRFFQEKHK